MTKIYSPIDPIYDNGEWPDVVSIDWRPNLALTPDQWQRRFDDFFSRLGRSRFPSLQSLAIYFPVRNLGVLSQYVTLRKLKCSGCSVKILPSESLVNLTHLECRSNEISEIPEYPSLEFLDCSYNRLGYLATQGLPRTLVSLTASHCGLLYKIRGDYPQLTYLDISHNRIKEMELSAPLLKRVYCHGNQLRSTRCFSGCRFLEYITCCDNPLEDLEGLGGSEGLKQVYACRGLVPADEPPGDRTYILIN